MGKVRKNIVVIGKKEQITEAIIDTGAERTMIKENILKQIGALFVGKDNLLLGGEKVVEKDLYLIKLRIDKCKMPLRVVTAGNKTLIGRDVLQASEAIIDQKRDIIIFPKCSGILEM